MSVCKTLTPVFAAPGDFLFREGDAAHEMFFLQSGSVEMRREATEHSPEFNETASAVAHFGEVALLLEGAPQRDYKPRLHGTNRMNPSTARIV